MIAGKDDDGGLLTEAFAQAAGEDEAGEIGEMNVDNGGGRGVVFLNVREGREPRMERGRREAVDREELAEGAGDRLAVIDDENRGAGVFSRGCGRLLGCGIHWLTPVSFFALHKQTASRQIPSSAPRG